MALALSMGSACGDAVQREQPSQGATMLPRVSGSSEAAQDFEMSIRNRARTHALSGLAAQRAEKRAAYDQAMADYEAAKARGERVKMPQRVKAELSPFVAEAFPKLRHPSLLAGIYDNGQRFVFVKDGALTPAGEQILDAVSHADEHAMDAERYQVTNLRAAAERLGRMATAISKTAVYPLNDGELQAIGGLQASDDEARMAMVCDFEKTPVPRAAAKCARAAARAEEYAAFEEALEYAVADLWLTWAEDMKYGNLNAFSAQEKERFTTPDNRDHIHPKHYDAIIEARLMAATQHLFQTSAEEALQRLIPQHEQYRLLQAVREKYRKIVDAGGWARLPADRMFAGGKAPLVAHLKTRLAAEGYYSGAIDEFFDEPLSAAVRAYQKHHQMPENGEVDDVFWRSLNVPAQQRLEEIEINIRRWHKTLFEPRESYVFVNLPSFEVEVYHKGARVAVHRAVIGNATRVCNSRTQMWERINATRPMHTRLTYLVFNPYWNVPPRIEVDEYQKKMAEDPKWLENSDFEYFNPRGGGRVLRQKPGPNNALGKVKLIFPNRDGVYFHDTPKQGMFEYPIRAFSHGCIRVEGAMEFAREILEIDGNYNEERIEQSFSEKGEHPVELHNPIDVFIEYHTVTADEAGNAYFLADVYRIVRDEIEPPSEADKRCDPNVDQVSRFKSGVADTGP